MLLILLNYGYVGKTVLIMSTPTQVVVAAVDSASSAGTFHIVVAMLGFDCITTDIAANGVFDNQYKSSFVKNSCIK